MNLYFSQRCKFRNKRRDFSLQASLTSSMVFPAVPVVSGSTAHCFLPRPHLLRSATAGKSFGAYQALCHTGLSKICLAQHVTDLWCARSGVMTAARHTHVTCMVTNTSLECSLLLRSPQLSPGCCFVGQSTKASKSSQAN